MKARLNLYFGSPESDISGTYLCLDLVLPGIGEFEMLASTRLNEEGDADVLEHFYQAVNKASLVRNLLNIPCVVDMEDIRTECVELGLSESAIREISTLVKEFRTQKGELNYD